MMIAVVRTVQIDIWGMLAMSRAVITIIFMQLRQFRDALYTYLIEASFARFIVDENYLDSLST